MTKRELLEKISDLPDDADIGVQVGSDVIDIADAELLAQGGGFFNFQCHPADLQDVLAEWGVPSEQISLIVSSMAPASSNRQGRQNSTR